MHLIPWRQVGRTAWSLLGHGWPLHVQPHPSLGAPIFRWSASLAPGWFLRVRPRPPLGAPFCLPLLRCCRPASAAPGWLLFVRPRPPLGAPLRVLRFRRSASLAPGYFLGARSRLSGRPSSVLPSIPSSRGCRGRCCGPYPVQASRIMRAYRGRDSLLGACGGAGTVRDLSACFV